MIRATGTGAVILALTASLAFAQLPAVHDLGLLPGDTSVSPAVSEQVEFSVARGGDQYLVVWSDYRGAAVRTDAQQSAVDVFGIRLDAQGAPIDAAPFLVAGGMGTQNRPLVAWNGTAWLVVYVSQDPVAAYYDNVMRAVRVSAAGQILDATPISFPPTEFSPNTVGMQVSGQNGQWLVTRCIYHSDGYGTYLAGQRIDGNGALLDPDPVMLIDWIYGATVSFAVNGEYVVGGPDWTNYTASARRIAQNLQPIGASYSVPSLSMASSGSELYMVWVKDYVNLVGSRMTPSGTLLNPAGTMILPNFTQLGETTLAHDGTQWWLEYGVNDQLHTIRISAAGAVIDANGGPLLPITIGGNVMTAYGPHLAGRPGGGVQFLWYDYRIALGNDGNVFTLPVSAANVPGSERLVSTGTRSQRGPDFAPGPNGTSAIVFVSEAANDRRVLVHFLDASGAAVNAEPLLVASGASIGNAGIAWNGSQYLVTWDGGTTGNALLPIKARRMNSDGSFVDAAPLDVMAGFDPDVEALGNNFLIACARAVNFQTITAYMRIVNGANGAFLNAATPVGGGYVRVGPRVKSNATQWIITYDSNWTHDSSQSDAVYHIVNADGSIVAGVNPTGSFGGSGTPDIAFSGSKYLFVWRSNSLSNANNYVSGRVINADGSFATSPFVIAEALGRQLRPVVGWDGTTFVVVWDDQRNQQSFFDERTDLYAARVSTAGVVLDPNGFPVCAGPQGDAAAALITWPDGRALVASARFSVAPPWDSYRIGLHGTGPEALAASGDARTVTMFRGSAPNPLRQSTSIAYVLAREAPVSLTVHDVQGRLVRTLIAGESRSAGPHEVEWDARAESGRRVSAGVYFCALSADTKTEVKRLVVLDPGPRWSAAADSPWLPTTSLAFARSAAPPAARGRASATRSCGGFGAGA